MSKTIVVDAWILMCACCEVTNRKISDLCIIQLWKLKITGQANFWANHRLVKCPISLIRLSIRGFGDDMCLLLLRVGLPWGKLSFYFYYSFKNASIFSWFHKLTLWNIIGNKDLAISLNARKIPGTSLAVQWLRIHPQCRGHKFDPWLGN